MIILTLVGMVIGTWFFARWLEQSGNADKLVSGSAQKTIPLSSSAGALRPISDNWMLFSALEMSSDGQVAVAAAMPRFSMAKILRNPPPSSFNPAANQKKTQQWVQQNLSPRLVVFDLAANTEREVAIEIGMSAAISTTSLALSPDGRSVAVALTKPVEGDVGATRDGEPLGIWLVDLQTKKASKLANEGMPRAWSPDGKTLAYRLHDTGKERWQVWAVTIGKSPRLIADLPLSTFRWSADGRFLLSTQAAQSPRQGDEEMAGRDAVRIDVATGAITKTALRFREGAPPGRLGPDQSVAAFAFGTKKGEESSSRLAVINLQAGQAVWLGKAYSGYVRVSGSMLDGRQVIVARDIRNSRMLWALSLTDGKFRPLLTSGDLMSFEGYSAVATGRASRRVLFSAGQRPDEVGKVMFDMFLGNGFGDTLFRLDLDEAKLAAQPGHDTPDLPAESSTK